MAISKKTRFEVFKRDSFTCQYCGKKAPNVVLHVDHIKPRKEGGEDSVINLITACLECNLGKGTRTLSDSAVISQQIDQLGELQKRREQLEMLMEWRDGLQSIDKDKVGYFNSRFVALTGYELSEPGRLAIEKLFKKYSLDIMMDSLEDAAVEYLSKSKAGGNTKQSVEKLFEKIPRVAFWKQKDIDQPHLGKLRYLRGIIRNRLRLSKCDDFGILNKLEACFLRGKSLDDLRAMALTVENIEDLDSWIRSALSTEGG